MQKTMRVSKRLIAVVFGLVLLVIPIFASVSLVVASPSRPLQASASAPTLDCTALGQAMGTIVTIPSGKTTGICDLVFVRQSPNIVEPNGMIDNKFTLMNSIIEFEVVPGSSTNQTVWVMGDFALLETEQNPVLDLITANHFTVISTHNHMLLEQPKLEFTHWMVSGTLGSIESVIEQALALTSIGKTTSITPQTALDCPKIAAAFGPTAVAVNGAVCDVIINRQVPANITSAAFPNIVLNKFGLISSVFEFAPMMANPQFAPWMGNTVMVMADYGLLETEAVPVVDYLVTHGANLTGLHPHMIEETPKMSWSHYTLEGSLNDTIAVLNGALARTSILGTPLKLTISTQNTQGQSITGYFSVLLQGGSVVETAFSPATFSLNNGEAYAVQVDNFGGCSFQSWSDGSTANPRPLGAISSDQALTALYSCS